MPQREEAVKSASSSCHPFSMQALPFGAYLISGAMMRAFEESGGQTPLKKDSGRVSWLHSCYVDAMSSLETHRRTDTNNVALANEGRGELVGAVLLGLHRAEAKAGYDW